MFSEIVAGAIGFVLGWIMCKAFYGKFEDSWKDCEHYCTEGYAEVRK